MKTKSGVVKWGLLALFILTGFVQSMAQTVVKGKIVDAFSKDPLQYVSVVFKGGRGTVTDSLGQYTLRSSGNISIIQISYVGYLNVQKNIIVGKEQTIDFELETAFITTDANLMGEPIPVDQAEDYIFGMVLFNDWSARDIQKWEYVPLGPFLAKNFASSISPWIVTMDALEPFRVKGPEQSPTPLSYLQQTGEHAFDINLEVLIKPENSAETTVSKSNFKYMYWSMSQQLAHHTVNGCRVNSGDMMGSGTISGPTEDSFGSMLELTWGGKNPIKMNDGTERKFINDNDTVIIRGFCQNKDIRIGFGECSSKLLPALEIK